MNFYGPETTEQHTLTGRVIPLFEAMQLAVNKASGRPLKERVHSAVLPEWMHNLCDKITTNLFKGLVDAAPRDNVVNAHNFGVMIGILLRGVVFYVKDVPAILEKDGLTNLSPEREAKFEKLAGLPQLFEKATEFFKKPVTDGETLVDAGAEHLGRKAEELMANFGKVMLYLFNRPVQEQAAFLDGVAKGFKVFLNNEAEFAGNKRRLNVYLALLISWPEIAEMQKSEPAKTRKDLLEWLEKQEGELLFEDPKNFYYLCDEISLDMGPPGHPAKAPVA